MSKKKNVTKILVKIVEVNTHRYTTYNGKEYLPDVLKEIYQDHAEFYKKELGVNLEDATLADWHPEDSSFDTTCGGWQRMINAGGIINKKIEEKQVPVKELVFKNS